MSDKSEVAGQILDGLRLMHSDPVCELNFKTPFELLVAVILSAQCTDKRVNEVTATLFRKYNTPEDFAGIDVHELERLIYSCGFYKNKAANIIKAATDILVRFGGKVPSTVDELTTLAGVGRKTANVVYAVAFGGQAMAVDTHADGQKRITCSYITGATSARREIPSATSVRSAHIATITLRFAENKNKYAFDADNF